MHPQNKHLAFYTENSLAPVRQFVDTENLMVYRGALYSGLGIPLGFIAGKKVLEVACGTGQNSLLLAARFPESLTLVEPNPTGMRHIVEQYENLKIPHTKPVLKQQRLEDFNSDCSYDLVICENWLGSRAYERELFSKLMGLCGTQGVLITTTIAPIGIFPNMLRRIISCRVAENATGESLTDILVDLWTPHLATMPGMTRPKLDWVQDNMVNPAYRTILISPVTLLQETCGKFDLLGTFPKFAQDFRWFKDIKNDSTENLTYFSQEYYKWCHGFIDYNFAPERGEISENKKLDDVCSYLFQCIGEWEISDSNNRANSWDKILTNLENITDISKQIYPDDLSKKIEKAIKLTVASNLDLDAIRLSCEFANLFGRETVYVSLSRKLT